ncbi:MAG: ester cyclase [Actinobacteria bacterium]|nr:ester cyclase [Actinomycetota bacterium]
MADTDVADTDVADTTDTADTETATPGTGSADAEVTASSAPRTTKAKTTPRAGELMAAAFGALAARDLEALAATWHPEIVEEFLVTGTIDDHDDLRAFFAETFAALPDLDFEVENIMEVDENTAVGQWHLRGTFEGGPWQGIAPTGKRVDIRGIDVMEFHNGLLVHNTVYYDGLTFARQVGLLPRQGSAPDRAMMAGFNALQTLRANLQARTKR